MPNTPKAGKVWIDTTSGTWGDARGLVIVDLDAQAVQDSLAGSPVDGFSLLAALEDMPDSDISAFGNAYGTPVAGEPDVRGCSCGMADYGAPGHDGDPLGGHTNPR